MTAEPPGGAFGDRCPTCSAAVKPGDPWCTLCYADLRPQAPEPPPPPSVATPSYDPLSDPLEPATTGLVTAPVAAASGPTWPCATCGAGNPMARDTCHACGMPFLSGLRDQEGPLLELPVVGDLTRLGRGQRFALAGAVVLAFLILTILIGLVFG